MEPGKGVLPFQGDHGIVHFHLDPPDLGILDLFDFFLVVGETQRNGVRGQAGAFRLFPRGVHFSLVSKNLQGVRTRHQPEDIALLALELLGFGSGLEPDGINTPAFFRKADFKFCQPGGAGPQFCLLGRTAFLAGRVGAFRELLQVGEAVLIGIGRCHGGVVRLEFVLHLPANLDAVAGFHLAVQGLNRLGVFGKKHQGRGDENPVFPFLPGKS